MNKALQQAKAKFRGQKAKMTPGGFDNSNVPPGKYTCQIVQSEIKDMSDKDKSVHPKHYLRLVVTLGNCKGRSGFPFKVALDDVDGITSFVKNVRAVLGDVVPGRTLSSGEFEYDCASALDKAEDFAHKMIGEIVEVQVIDNKKGKPKDDGTPWQSWYINRGLGQDADGVKGQDKDEDHPDNQIPGLGGDAKPKTKNRVAVHK